MRKELSEYIEKYYNPEIRKLVRAGDRKTITTLGYDLPPEIEVKIVESNAKTTYIAFSRLPSEEADMVAGQLHNIVAARDLGTAGSVGTASSASTLGSVVSTISTATSAGTAGSAGTVGCGKS